MRHPRRMLRQTLHTAQRLRQREQPRRRQELFRLDCPAFDPERDHPSVREPDPLERLLRVSSSSGVRRQIVIDELLGVWGE